MKKYVKPELRFESYKLNHSVADCGWELQLGSVETCHAVGDANLGFPDFVQIFTPSNEQCVHGDMDYCYQNGADGSMPLFRS